MSARNCPPGDARNATGIHHAAPQTRVIQYKYHPAISNIFDVLLALTPRLSSGSPTSWPKNQRATPPPTNPTRIRAAPPLPCTPARPPPHRRATPAPRPRPSTPATRGCVPSTPPPAGATSSTAARGTRSGTRRRRCRRTGGGGGCCGRWWARGAAPWAHRTPSSRRRACCPWWPACSGCARAVRRWVPRPGVAPVLASRVRVSDSALKHH